jgi:hypothetical protein
MKFTEMEVLAAFDSLAKDIREFVSDSFTDTEGGACQTPAEFAHRCVEAYADILFQDRNTEAEVAKEIARSPAGLSRKE